MKRAHQKKIGDLSFDMSGDRAARARVQGELESAVDNFDTQARQRLGLQN